MNDGIEDLRSFTLNLSVGQVDPEVLGILTGGMLGDPPAPTFALESYTPARRRTLWEWMRRRPRHLASYTYIPQARIESIEERRA